MNSTAFGFVLLAIFAYGIQLLLLYGFARKFDGLFVSVVRNLSLIVTMSPVLLFAPTGSLGAVFAHPFLVFGACATGAVAIICNLSAARFMPIGVGRAINQLCYVCITVFIGLTILHDQVSTTELVLIVGLVVTGACLTLFKSPSGDFVSNPKVGIPIVLCGGFFQALTYLCFSQLTHVVNPLAAGYVWEGGIGIFAFFYVFLLWIFNYYKVPEDFHAWDIGKIVLVSFLTVFGTVGSSMAFFYGRYTIVTALLTTTALVTAVGAWLVYSEKLKRSQWIAIGVAIALIILLDIVR